LNNLDFLVDTIAAMNQSNSPLTLMVPVVLIGRRAVARRTHFEVAVMIIPPQTTNTKSRVKAGDLEPNRMTNDVLH
jgi:hypothetical protein